MNGSATPRGNLVLLSQCSSCCDLRFQPYLPPSSGFRHLRCSWSSLKLVKNRRLRSCRKREIACRVTEPHSESDGNNEEEKHENGETQSLADSSEQNNPQSSDGEQLNRFEDENQGQNDEQIAESLKMMSMTSRDVP